MSTTERPLPADFPTDELPEGFPSARGVIGELGTVKEPVRLALAHRRLAAAPRGDGRTTITLPGWKASGSSMLPIRRYLSGRGHRGVDWGLGVNGDDVEATRDAFLPMLEARVAAGDGRPANLVGWSLGGVIAREAARERPDLVNRVVIFGSPIIGGPSHTPMAPTYGEAECARVSDLAAAYDAERPVARPLLSVFTRNDNIVDWRACIDWFSVDVQHLEVRSTHIGLGLDPDVWVAAAQFLTEPLG